MKCLECGHDLIEMRRELVGFTIDVPKTENDFVENWGYSRTEYAGHCENCLRDWSWEETYEFGDFLISRPQRIFWG
jgi:hypothetical protein